MTEAEVLEYIGWLLVMFASGWGSKKLILVFTQGIEKI